MAFAAISVGERGQKYPTITSAWQRVWDRFIPFLALSSEERRVIYTTNAIESL